MTGLSEGYATAKVVAGVAIPALVLAVALGQVGLELLAGAGLALGTTFGVVYAYARYVELDAESGRSGVRRADSETDRVGDGYEIERGQ